MYDKRFLLINGLITYEPIGILDVGDKYCESRKYSFM